MNAINIECMLLGWAETHAGGAKIVLQLADPDDLEPFKAMTVAKGKIAGQRLACAFVQIGDDEQPVQPEQPKGGPLAQLAGRWCGDETFRIWLCQTYPDVVEAIAEASGSKPFAEVVAQAIRAICGVQSRAQLDHDHQAATRFNAAIRHPYQAHLQGLA